MNETNLTSSKATHSPYCFSGRAEDYAKYRPNYPANAIDMMLEGLDTSRTSLKVANIGAGTGIASRQLAFVRLIRPSFLIHLNDLWQLDSN